MKRPSLILATALSVVFLTACSSGKEGAYISQGYSDISSQNYVTSLESFDQALLADEDAELAHRGRGLAFMGAGEYEKALSAFQMALSSADMFPGDLEYDINYYMAVCYYKLGEYDKAIAVYDSIVDLRPKDANAYYLRGDMKLYVSDVDGAIEDFNKAISLNKKSYGMYIDIYQIMTEHGYADQANQYLDVVMSADTDDIGAYDKGRLCYFQGDYSRACTYLETARQADENKASSELITLLGECYKKEGNYEFAAVIYSSYLEGIQDPAVYNQLGLCYIEQGDYQAALKAFQSGIDIRENNTCMQTLKLNEIVSLEYMGEYDSARDKLAEYMSTYPSDSTMEKEYTFLSTR